VPAHIPAYAIRLESAGPGRDMPETRTSKGFSGDSPAALEYFGRIGQPIRRSGVRRAQTLKMSVFFFPSISERVPMNKLIAVLVAGLFATSVFAQTTAPAAPAAKAEAKAEKADVKANKAEAKTDAKADAKAAAAEAKAAKAKAAADAKAEKAKAKADAKAAKAKAAADAKAAAPK
jgi:hypothetical protein